MKQYLFYQLYSDTVPPSNTALFSNYTNINPMPLNVHEDEVNYFSSHELQVENQAYLPRESQSNDFFFPFLIGNLIIIIIALSIYRKQFLHSILSLFSAKHYQQIELKTIIKHPIVFIFFFLFIINFSLIADYYLTSSNLDLSISSFPSLFLITTLSLLTFYFTKIIMILISGQIFKVANYGRVYVDYILIWTMNIAVFLGVLLWLVVYFDIKLLLPISIGIWVIFDLLRLVQTYLKIVPKSSYNPFHFFMYLCAVEILPLIVLGKIMMMQIK